VECATSAGTSGVIVQVMDDGTPGGRVYWRAFGASGGPALPGPIEETVVDATRLHVVEARAATLPAPIAASPQVEVQP
jgi:hypothetical protein